MKALMKYFVLVAVVFGAITIQDVTAKSKKEYNLPEKLTTKIEGKVQELTRDITKEIGLSEKQAKKIHAIKLTEAMDIETVRVDKAKSQQESKNEIILIKNNANNRILKVLKKDQDVLWNAKKDKFAYSPGFMENLKDIYHQTKEAIQEKLGLD